MSLLLNFIYKPEIVKVVLFVETVVDFPEKPGKEGMIAVIIYSGNIKLG